MSRSRPDKARRRAVAQELRTKRAALREDIRQRLERHRRATPRKRSTRRWRWLLALLILLLLLLLLLRNCSCGTEASGPPPVDEPASPLPGADEPEVTPPEAPPNHRVARRDRPEYALEQPEPLPWITAFRLQVAARSPRLAECFVGAHRPGTLKWTAEVEPIHGRVSDHTLEPTLLSDALTRPQRACALEVLSDPPYTLEAGSPRSTPSRVGIVIEF